MKEREKWFWMPLLSIDAFFFIINVKYNIFYKCKVKFTELGVVKVVLIWVIIGKK
jgi:hypothetical protein